MDYIMALDAGTTSSRTVIYDNKANVVSISQKEFTQIYPKASWVEHDPEEIWQSQLFTIKDSLKKANLSAKDIKAVGITNQRETTLVIDKTTGKAVCNAIVWQCRRTSDMCEELSEIKGFSDYVEQNTGLKIDAYFSATKIKWILDNIRGVRDLAKRGDAAFMTVDSYLIYRLSAGKYHITDYSNASRTMLYNINELCWDDFILDTLKIPKSMLPEVVSSSGVCAYTEESIFGSKVPISGIAGDQQASLFGQGCFEKGEAKNTYGTGCFLLMNMGDKPVASKNGLVGTIAWRVGDSVSYALEGSVFMGGALIQWLRDEMELIKTSEESYDCAMKTESTEGAYIVPAFTGLGAPYWDMHARGIITNLTRGVNKNHIVRAALEAIAYQVRDLLVSIEADSAIRLKELMVDGGACANDFLMQFQSDILGVNVNRPQNTESTSLGAAFLAGLGVGIFKDFDELKSIRQTQRIFTSEMDIEKVKGLTEGWNKAVRMCVSK